MNIQLFSEKDITILKLTGDIDSRSAPEFQDQAQTLVREKPKLLIDMSEVKFMSSAGLRVILSLWRQKPAGSRIILAGLSEPIKDTMEVTGFLELFTLTATIPEGLALLSH